MICTFSYNTTQTNVWADGRQLYVWGVYNIANGYRVSTGDTYFLAATPPGHILPYYSF